MTEREQPESETEYWNVDEQIAEVTLWRGEHYGLRLKAHVADEIYRHQAQSDEIIPLKHHSGVQTYVQAKPYVLVPDVTLTIGLHDRPDPSGAIGEVTSSTWEGMRQEEVGHCQSWFYVEDRTIILWEAFLLPHYRSGGLLQDANTYALWEGFEKFLTDRFPSAQQLVTTYADPEYEPTEQYQEFLRAMGYQQLNTAAFGKEVRHR